MRVLAGGVWALLVLAPLLASCDDVSVRATFRDVSDRRGSNLFDADYGNARDVPDYVVREGRLYLRVRAYRAHRPRPDAVQPRFWTCSEVARLKRSRDARALLPNARAVDGGIRWSACSQAGRTN